MSLFGSPIDIPALVDWCAGEISAGIDHAEFMRHIQQQAASMLLENTRSKHDKEGLRRLVLVMARSIWRAMPHPAHRYAPAPLPASGRNEPCFCGSGSKYKRCCAQLERDAPTQGMDYLPMLLDALPKKRWPELVDSRVDPWQLANVVSLWQRAGKAPEAMLLLEIWFAPDRQLIARHGLLFDQLLDLYDELGHPRKKLRLLERGAALGDRKTRSAALQRHAALLGDKGNFKAAWKMFDEAQRQEPDSPRLSILEIVLLSREGREAEARERARCWLPRLQHRPDPDAQRVVEMLRTVIEKGFAALDGRASNGVPPLPALEEAWSKAPQPEVPYTLQGGGASSASLLPSPALRPGLEEWREFLGLLQAAEAAGDGGEPQGLDARIRGWIALLERHPILWNAFNVLDDLQAGLGELSGPEAARLRGEIVDRGVALLEAVLDGAGAMNAPLEWRRIDNRPALRLLGARLERDFDRPAAEIDLGRLEWLVRVLNPNDNQGFRDELLARYLELGRFDEACDLAARYPGDMASMQYGGALALRCAGRLREADAALARAIRRWPKTREWMLRKRASQPPGHQLGIIVGGDEEAWMYRQRWLPLWSEHAALDWLRDAQPAADP